MGGRESSMTKQLNGNARGHAGCGAVSCHHRPSPERFYLPHLKLCPHETLTSNHHLTSCLFEFARLGASREGSGTPLQYSSLENPMDRGAWWAAVHGVAKSGTRLSDFPFTFMHWRRKRQPTPVFLPGESHGQRSLAGYSPRVAESDTTERLRLHLLWMSQALLPA